MTVMAWGFLIAAAFWAVAAPLWSFPTDLAAGVWAKLIWVGVAGTALPFLIEFAALRRAAAGLVGVVATAEPVVGAVAAWIMLEQQLDAAQIIGGLMVVVSVASIQQWGLPEAPYDIVR
jgi:drug/metabolite transporter (DMT)-like permease